MVEDPVIPARIAPDDFPEGLPIPPPTPDEKHQLCELWNNVNRIHHLRTEDWNGIDRCEYMLWTTEDMRQFRVIWEPEEGGYLISERHRPL
jgi:hypothetical protein